MPNKLTKFLTIAVVLALFGLIAILTSGCTVTPEMQEVLNAEVNDQSPAADAQPTESVPDWAKIDRVGSWERMYDRDTGVVCYSKDGIGQQDCFYLGGQ